MMPRLKAAVVRRALPTGDTEQLRYRAWAMTPEGRKNVAALRVLKNRYGGRRAIVMGNGPTLLKCDLNAFAEEVTIVSNAHYLVWGDLSYRPTFLTVEDRLVAEDRADELRALTGVTKIFPFDLRRFLPLGDPDTLHVNFPRSYNGFPRFSDDLARCAYWGGTVSYLNLQLAAYLGCNPVVLVGFDHSYKVPEERTEGDVITSTTDDVNHIHPDYFGPGYRWHDPQLHRMEEAYTCARAALEARGVRILNATEGGHLEIFERATLSEALL